MKPLGQNKSPVRRKSPCEQPCLRRSAKLMKNCTTQWKQRNRAIRLVEAVSEFGPLLLIALIAILVLDTRDSLGDEPIGLRGSRELELLEAIRGSSATWQKNPVRVAFQIEAADRQRADELRNYAVDVLTQTLDVVEIALHEVEQGEDITLTVTDSSNSPLPPAPENACGYTRTQRDRQIIQASATIVLGFASRECVRVLALNIAGLSGPSILNVRGTTLSRAMTSDELTDVDRFLLKLAYAPASQVKQLISENEAVSRFVAPVYDLERAKLWSAQLQLALDAQTVDERRRNTYAAFKVLGFEQADPYRQGTTMAWLSVFNSHSGQLDDAIKNTSAALELLKMDASSADGTDILSLEVNLRKLQVLSKGKESCANGTALSNFPPSLGHIVGATAHYAEAFCDYLSGELTSAATNIEKALDECEVAYFGLCPNWETFYVSTEIHAARGEAREAVRMLELAKGFLLQMVPAVDKCTDIQHVRLEIAKLSHNLGELNAAKDVSIEALSDEGCRSFIPSNAMSEFSNILQQH